MKKSLVIESLYGSIATNIVRAVSFLMGNGLDQLSNFYSMAINKRKRVRFPTMKRPKQTPFRKTFVILLQELINTYVWKHVDEALVG